MINPRDIAGRLRQLANDLDDLAEEQESDLGRRALEVMDRSCQQKRSYTTAEAAGQAAADRVAAGEQHDLRVYQCFFCKGFHLTKRKLEEFQQSKDRR